MADLSTLASLGAAFGAGVLSVLSPCVMPLMPAYLSLVSGVSIEEMHEGRADAFLRRRILRASLGFVLGFSTVFVVLGATATVLGQVLRTFRIDLFGLSIGASQIAGLVIVVMGLHLAGWLPIPALYRDARFHGAVRPKGSIGTFLVGAAFAFGWSPCVGPILGGILTLAGSRETLAEGVALLSVYSAGLGVPFLLAGMSIELFFRAFQRLKRHFRALEVASGAFLVLLGVLVATDQLARLNGYFGFLNDVVATAERGLF